MTPLAERFDDWIRTRFVAMNTALEELYFAQDDRAEVRGAGEEIKAALRDEGAELISALLREGNTGAGFESAFAVLGNVGLYLGAMRRHELTNPDREEKSPFPQASSLALQAGAAIGMAPRFATAHLATHNLARNGLRKSFTALADETIFIDENTRGILCLQRAADALARILPLGITSPIAALLLSDAGNALADVARFNHILFDTLDVERFFYCVRPYYKPYRVGRQVFRGANAGDFSGINEIDLLLGLCRARDPYYAQLIADKMPFMLPEEQARLRLCMTRRSLLDQLLDLLPSCADESWFRDNGRAFLAVCDAFAETARQHHDMLVERFIVGPAATLGAEHLNSLTASGPPLPVLIESLEILRDYRRAAPRADLDTRHRDLERLRRAVGQ